MVRCLLYAASFVALSVAVAAVWLILILQDLPDVSILKHYRPAAAAEAFDKDGNVLGIFADRTFRIWVPLSSVPEMVVRTVIIAEDDTFFEHKGVNYKAKWEALVYDIKVGRFARGGSTITQQMIKNVLLSREKTISRKVREIVLAKRAEKILTKHQILEIYLNVVEWGENIFGIEAASRFYFDKHASELTLSEATLLAGMLPNPRYFNPYKRMDKARKRQERILFNMLQAKLITQDEYDAALNSVPTLREGPSNRFDLSVVSGTNGRPCHLKALEKILLSKYGEHGLYRQGLKLRLSIDRGLQDYFAADMDLPSEVVVVMEKGIIRAVACMDGETVSSILDAAGPPYDGYEYMSLPLHSIRPEDVLMEE